MLNYILKLLTDTYNWYSEITKANHFLAAVVFGGVLGATWIWIKGWWRTGIGFIYGRLFVTMRTEYTSALTESTGAAEGYYATLISHVTTNSRALIKPSRLQPNYVYKVGRRTALKALIVPGDGDHWLNYNGTLLRMSVGTNDKGGWVTITTFAWNREVFSDIILSITETKDGVRDTIDIFTNIVGGWVLTNELKRGIDTVISIEVTKLLGRIIKWKENHDAKKYDGLPGKLSFLLTGPPGTGKSSVIAAIAAFTGLPIYNIRVGALKENDIGSIVGRIASMAIVVVEDAPFTTEDLNNPKSSVGASTLLNLLEGTGGLKNCIVIVTHNNPEKFDQRFLQSGRLGHIVVLDHWVIEEFVLFLNKHYPNRDYCVGAYLKNQHIGEPEWYNHINGNNKLKKSPAAIATLAADNIDDYASFVNEFGVSYEKLIGDETHRYTKVNTTVVGSRRSQKDITSDVKN